MKRMIYTEKSECYIQTTYEKMFMNTNSYSEFEVYKVTTNYIIPNHQGFEIVKYQVKRDGYDSQVFNSFKDALQYMRNIKEWGW